MLKGCGSFYKEKGVFPRERPRGPLGKGEPRGDGGVSPLVFGP